MADNRMKGRVRGLLGGPTVTEAPDLVQGGQDADAQRQALQVLVLAQRTADEHVAAAQRHVEGIRAEARAAAEQIARDAQAHADGARREAGKALSDARAAAEQIVREAQAYANGVHRDAEKVLVDARASAQEMVKDAQEKAAELDRAAQQRHDDVVGSLAGKRDALQQQIEALQHFDHEYRSRLRTFMHSQLRALGDEEPPPTAGVHDEESVAPAEGQTSESQS